MSTLAPDVRRRALRAVLGFLAISALFPGAWATLAPGSFYTSFPLGAAGSWVSPLSGPSEHFTTDIGAFYLAFGFILAWAAWRPDRTLVVPVCLGWAGFSTLHAAWHALNLGPLTATDAAAQMATLVLVLIGPALALLLSRAEPSEG